MDKDIIDLDSVIENKLKDNLQWSMLFAIFNYISSEIENKEKDDNSLPRIDFSKKFFKNWKKHVCNNIIKKDLEAIHTILNSPKNIFYSTLRNDSEESIESTELYQEKYNNIIKKIEMFYINNIPKINNE